MRLQKWLKIAIHRKLLQIHKHKNENHYTEVDTTGIMRNFKREKQMINVPLKDN